MVDIASRVHNHNWKIDPIVRSLIDTDFYKLLMCQSIFRNKPETNVEFSLINRSTRVRLADLIDEGELREQLDHVRSLSLTRGESTWLRGNTFYGKRQMFRPDFMEWFEGLRLPAYHLEKRDGQYELTFEGSWPEVMLWEIPALAVLMELRSRAVLKSMGKFELQVLYARAMTKLWEKITRLKAIDGLKIADFGIAKIVGREEGKVPIAETNLAIGTPHYISPEQARGDRVIDRRADLRFSFDGDTLLACRGDTLASALLANGVRARAGTYRLDELGGLAKQAPVLAALFVAATMASIAAWPVPLIAPRP